MERTKASFLCSKGALKTRQILLAKPAHFGRYSGVQRLHSIAAHGGHRTDGDGAGVALKYTSLACARLTAHSISPACRHDLSP